MSIEIEFAPERIHYLPEIVLGQWSSRLWLNWVWVPTDLGLISLKRVCLEVFGKGLESLLDVSYFARCKFRGLAILTCFIVIWTFSPPNYRLLSNATCVTSRRDLR